MYKLITHNAKFHADDVFSASLLKNLFKVDVNRTRNITEDQLNDPTYIIFDIGHKYSPESNVYDHHQKGGALTRASGIKYAAFGLIWKHFGYEYLKQFNYSQDKTEYIHNILDATLVSEIDGVDNGQLSTHNYESSYDCLIPITSLASTINTFNPSVDDPVQQDFYFNKAVEFATVILNNTVESVSSEYEAEVYFKSNVSDLPYVVLPYYMNWQSTALKYSHLKYIIIPRVDSFIGIQVPLYKGSNTGRSSFKKEYRGLNDSELQKVSNVSDAVFCHANGFCAVAKSLEGVIKLIQASL